MRIVGFHGPMHSGKDTACLYLSELLGEYGLTVERRGFADALKVSAARALGAPVEWTVEQCRDFCDDLKRSARIDVLFSHVEVNDEAPGGATEHYWEPLVPEGITGRQYLQWYGTEAHRDVFGFDFWVNALLPLPSTSWDHGQARADNDAVLARGFPGADVLAISDVRFENEAQRILDLGGSVVRIVRPEEGRSDAHASENPLPDALVTHTLTNGGTLDEFRASVAALAHQLELVPR